jgi:hypothetical protein
VKTIGFPIPAPSGSVGAMRTNWLVAAVTLVAGVGSASCSSGEVNVPPRVYVGYPEKLDPNCRDGKARIFDECSDQMALFEQARARAKADGKVLMVEFGSEWCIWCHVFDAHINGEHNRFRYTYGSPDEPDQRYTSTLEEGDWADTKAAQELRSFVAENFVLVHIELGLAPNGDAVLESTDAAEHFTQQIPFVCTVDDSGRFAARFEHDPAERRRDSGLNWYRGYDRKNMLEQLEAMRDAARSRDGAADPSAN